MRKELIAAALVMALSGAPARADVLFQAEAQTLQAACAGGAVILRGNHNDATLTGPCRSLLVQGVANTVHIPLAPDASVRVEGSQNRVQYRGPTPSIVVLGPDNTVAEGTVPTASLRANPPPAPTPPPAPPSPHPAPEAGALHLDGLDREAVADCSGRDATITGSRSAYQLHGACRSLTVRGELLTIRADLASAARVAVAGRGIVVTWTTTGRPPLVTLRGPGSRVQRALR